MTGLPDIEIMARTIYGEARGETQLAKLAVASVILNRVRKGGWFGNSIIEVCKKPKQFSCWNSDDPNRAKIEAVGWGDLDFQRCALAALQALTAQEADPTQGATHYHAIGIKPKWADSLKMFGSIGHHVFYHDK